MTIILKLNNSVNWQSKFGTFCGKLVSFWGALPPQTPYRGSAPGPRWGTSVPQTPYDLLPRDKLLATPLHERKRMCVIHTTADIHTGYHAKIGDMP